MRARRGSLLSSLPPGNSASCRAFPLEIQSPQRSFTSYSSILVPPISAMASSSSSSENRYCAVRTTLIQPILDNLSNLHQQLSVIVHFHVGDRKQQRGSKLELLCRELEYIKSAFEKLDSLGGHVGERLSLLENCVHDVIEHVQRAPESGPVSTGEVQNKIHSLDKSIASLKVLLPPVSGVTSTPPIAYRRVDADSGVHIHNELFEQNAGDSYSSIFKELIGQLDERAKQLLRYFAAFPRGTIINKRVLKNWWIAEELYQLPAVEAENEVDRVLEELVFGCMIEEVRKQRRLVGFKMPHSWIHLALVRDAMGKKFFAFDSKGNPTVQPMTSSKWCLTKTEGGGSSLNLLNDNYETRYLEDLQTVFNVSEQYPHFREEFFSKAKHIGVLSLGKWQGSGDSHIEVESTDFLKAPKSLKDLRFFSLRGVSRVFELPDALCKLSSLMILDLNACYNLEELPEEIGLLKRLIYLDISECYLLERMPKGLASLTELRVLKGFLIIDTAYGLPSCNFKDLSGLKKLIKLGISSNRSDFPTDDDLDTFQKFSLLEKLTISWGGKSIFRIEAKSAANPETEVRSPQNNSPLNPKSELQPREAYILSNTGEAVEDGAAEPRKISDGNNPQQIQDNREGASSAAEPELSGVRNRDDAGNVAEKETEPRVQQGTGNAREIVEEAEPAREEETTNAVNAGNTLERKGSVEKPEQMTKRVNIRDVARRDQPSDLAKKQFTKSSSFLKSTTHGTGAVRKPEDNIFPRLKKLNLHCYPNEEAPDWLKPENMKKLKKLYIAGGKLCTLDKVQGNRAWTVEILRLKYLEELGTSWEDLQAMFPELIYLEKVQHDQLTTFERGPKGEWLVTPRKLLAKNDWIP